MMNELCNIFTIKNWFDIDDDDDKQERDICHEKIK